MITMQSCSKAAVLDVAEKNCLIIQVCGNLQTQTQNQAKDCGMRMQKRLS